MGLIWLLSPVSVCVLTAKLKQELILANAVGENEQL